MNLTNFVQFAIIIGGIVGLVAVIITWRINRLHSILRYYETGDDIDSVIRRDRVFSANEEYIKSATNKYNKKEYRVDKNVESDSDYQLFISMKDVCNFWHRWGLMVRKGYLPLWVFHGVSGKGAKNLYDKMKYFINARKKGDGTEGTGYVVHYEWLINTLIKRDEVEKNSLLSKMRFHSNLYLERLRKLPIKKLED